VTNTEHVHKGSGICELLSEKGADVGDGVACNTYICLYQHGRCRLGVVWREKEEDVGKQVVYAVVWFADQVRLPHHKKRTRLMHMRLARVPTIGVFRAVLANEDVDCSRDDALSRVDVCTASRQQQNSKGTRMSGYIHLEAQSESS
jgi:hypothetical protein